MSTNASFGISVCGFPQMSLNPPARAFLPHYQFPCDPHISLCNSTPMSLPLVQISWELPPSITSSPAPPLRQPITDGTFILPLIQPENPSKQAAGTLQPRPGTSSLLPSPLQHQAQCLQAIHKTIQQFRQHLKAEQLHRKALQTIVLQLQNDFALQRYLLSLRLEQFPSVILPLKTPLPVHQLTLTLTLLQMHSCFPALLNLQFLVLPRRAL